MNVSEKIKKFYDKKPIQFSKIAVEKQMSSKFVPYKVIDNDGQAGFTLQGLIKNTPYLSVFGNYTGIDKVELGNITTTNSLGISYLALQLSIDEIPLYAQEQFSQAMIHVNSEMEKNTFGIFTKSGQIQLSTSLERTIFKNQIVNLDFRVKHMRQSLGLRAIEFDMKTKDPENLFQKMNEGKPTSSIRTVMPEFIPESYRFEGKQLKRYNIEEFHEGDYVQIDVGFLPYAGIGDVSGMNLYIQRIILIEKNGAFKAAPVQNQRRKLQEYEIISTDDSSEEDKRINAAKGNIGNT